MKKYYCIENCGREISKNNALYGGQKRCAICSGKYRWKKYNINLLMQSSKIKEKRIKNRRSFKGSNNPMYGKKRPDVIARNKKMIGENSPSFGRHPSHVEKQKMSKKAILRWKDKIFRNKTIKATLKGLRLHPNKPEIILRKLLNKLFPNEYKFVGDGKVILAGFCPDFINVNGQKKIIELYGDYWHNLPNWKKRDKRRLQEYFRLGYQTLIIWEKDLKNIDKLKQKLLEFNRK